MKVIGLTGNIGTGKSTAASVIKEFNIKIIDCDIVSREVVEYNEVLEILKDAFGDSIISEDGKLLRKELGKIVFNDKEKLDKLNSIMHPIMRKRIEECISEFSKTEKICVLDGAILIEAKFYDLVQDTILISSSEENQLKRVHKRDGHDYEYIKGIIKSQMLLKEKEKYCKYIIYNNEGIEELRTKVSETMKEIIGTEAQNV